MEKTTTTQQTSKNAKKALKERKEIVSCPKSLKINLQEENKKGLKEMANNGFVIIYDVAERQIALSKSMKVLNESIDKLNAKVLKGEKLNESELSRLQKDTQTVKEYQEKFMVYRNIKKEVLKGIYATLKPIYNGYAKDCKNRNSNYKAMNDAFATFFAQYDIEYKGALKSWFMNLATIQETGANDILKGQMFKALKEDAFCKKMLKGIIDIAICKNAITFTSIDKSVVKFFEEYADIDESIKVVEEEPTTIDGYKALFEEVGILYKENDKKEVFEKTFKRYANRMFIYKA